jgi:CBS domain-containing protein
MSGTESPVLTARELMSRAVEPIRADTPMCEAARWLAQHAVHGAPVVDDEGRCVGVLSASDLVRWVTAQVGPRSPLAPTCGFQDTCREPGGRETVLCRRESGACPFQHIQEMCDGRPRLTCAEPYSVPVDWQMVRTEAAPGDVVRDFMTTAVITAEAETPVPELARLMLEHRVNRLLVLDARRHPVGVVAVSDLVQVLAHPELTAPGRAP